MTRNEMLKAVTAIHQGKSFEQTELSINVFNLVQWNELKSEIENGYSIDVPLDIRA